MTRRVTLAALLLCAVAVAASALRLAAVWNQALAIPPEGTIITVAKGESLSKVLARAEHNAVSYTHLTLPTNREV